VYCVEGYQSFRALEHEGLVEMVQLFVNLGAKYGRFDVKDALVGRKTVAEDVMRIAETAKNKINDVLRQPVSEGCIALCMDIYTDDYKKRSFLDLHAFYVDHQYVLRQAALAVHHFGTVAHTADNVY
jgi:hypothetical protein